MSGVFGVGPASPPRLLRFGIGKEQIGGRRLTLWLACVMSLLAGSASPHDASSYGGVFRSRDLGAAWFGRQTPPARTPRGWSAPRPCRRFRLGICMATIRALRKVRAVRRGHRAD